MLSRVEKSVIMCKEQPILTKSKRVDKFPNIARKDWSKKVQKAFIELFPKNEINASNWISFCRESYFVKETNFELELLKIVFCFLDEYGNYDSKSIPFGKHLKN